MTPDDEDERTDEERAQSARESLSRLTPDDQQDADGTTRDVEQDPEVGGG
jgi:hypothetical protein